MKSPAWSAPRRGEIENHAHPLVQVCLKVMRLTVDVGDREIWGDAAIGQLCKSTVRKNGRSQEGEELLHERLVLNSDRSRWEQREDKNTEVLVTLRSEAAC